MAIISLRIVMNVTFALLRISLATIIIWITGALTTLWGILLVPVK